MSARTARATSVNELTLRPDQLITLPSGWRLTSEGDAVIYDVKRYKAKLLSTLYEGTPFEGTDAPKDIAADWFDEHGMLGVAKVLRDMIG
jgi:hypothetical protein